LRTIQLSVSWIGAPKIKRWRGVEANQLSEKGFPLLLRERQAIAAVIEAGTTSTDNMIEVVKNTP
jgi:hypothetical protein